MRFQRRHKIGLAIGIIAAGLGLGYLLKEKREPINLVSEIKYVEHLDLNNNTKFRTTKLGTLEEGIKDIRLVAEKRDDEDAWAFLPDNNQWIEIGSPTKPEVSEKEYTPLIKQGLLVSRATEIDIIYILDLIRANNQIRKLQIWHTHPKISDSDLFNQNKKHLKEKGIEISEEKESSIKLRISIASALPGRPDLMIMLGRAKRIKNSNPDIFVTEFIASPYGICEFKSTEKGLRKYLLDQEEFIVKTANEAWDRARLYEVNLPTAQHPYNSERVDTRRFLCDKVNELATRMTSKDLVVNFTPY